jgi:predicted DNA-binding protein (MmcQ/YjbR family)
MNIEELRTYCLEKKGAKEDFPFDETTLVFKVMGKMFALTDLESDLAVNLKCEPNKCQKLKEEFSAVRSGYHMNKKHWITVVIDGTIPDNDIYYWIDCSYNLVVKSLTKKQKNELERMD